MKGANGFLCAVQVAESLFLTGAIKRALIVSSDMHPSQKPVADFPFAHLGAAALLEYSNDKNKGFRKIMSKTADDENFYGVRGYLDWKRCGVEGRNHIVIDVQDNYSDKLQDFTIESLREFYYSDNENELYRDVNLSDIKFLTSVPVRRFGKSVIESIEGLKENKNPVICLYEKYGDPHSSATTIAYHDANAYGFLEENDNVLFVSSGSGLSVSAGLYTV